MAKIKITSKLIGNLSEAYYKEYCDQHGWAYISLEQIHENGIKNRILKFKKGFQRVMVKVPDEIIEEIKNISKPSNSSILNPSYVYDYLACRVGLDFNNIVNVKEKKDFRWIEVKTGTQDLDKNQIRTVKKISLPLVRFRVVNPLILSQDVQIYWDEVNSEYLSRFRK